MKLYKHSERNLKAHEMLNTMQMCGFKTKNVGEYCKWKEVFNGRLQVSLTIYRISSEQFGTSYMVEDTLGRVACPLVTDRDEVFGWLKEHGYKPVKQWYLEDYGMSEETWNAWNSNEEI